MALQRNAPPLLSWLQGWLSLSLIDPGRRQTGGGCFLHGRKMLEPLNPCCVWDRGEVGQQWAPGQTSGRRRKGMWEEWKDGWAPTTGDNTPCLEVCCVLDSCLVLALKDIIHVTQLPSPLMSQKMHLQKAIGRTRSEASVLESPWKDSGIYVDACKGTASFSVMKWSQIRMCLCRWWRPCRGHRKIKHLL